MALSNLINRTISQAYANQTPIKGPFYPGQAQQLLHPIHSLRGEPKSISLDSNQGSDIRADLSPR